MNYIDILIWLKSFLSSKYLLLGLLFIAFCISFVFTYVLESGKSLVEGPFVSERSALETETQNPSSDLIDDIYVDLGGAVRKPGIYKLNRGAHLADLLKVSGGVNDETVSAQWFLKYVNLAKTLEDEQKIYIPFDWEVYESTQSIVDLSTFPIITTEVMLKGDKETPVDNKTAWTNSSNSQNSGAKSETSKESIPAATQQNTPKNISTSSLINVNTADSKTLETLPGIGPVYAEKIIQNRPYSSITELKSKSKLSDSLIDKLKDAITF